MQKRFLFAIIVLLFSIRISGQEAEQSISLIDSIISEFDHLASEEKIRSLLSISEAYRPISFDKSITTGETALNSALTTEDYVLAAQIHRSLAISARETGDFPMSNEFFQNAADLYEYLDDHRQLGYILQNMAVNFMDLSEPDKAEELLMQAELIANQTKDDTLKMMVISNWGRVHFDSGDLLKAFEVFNQAIIMAENLKQVQEYVGAKLNQATIFWQWDENEKAIGIFKEIYPIAEENGFTEQFSKINNNIGLAYLWGIGMPDSALYYFEKAREIREAKGWTKSLADLYVNISAAHMEKGNYDLAKDLLINALKVFETSGNKDREILSHYHLGEIYLRQENYQQSHYHLTQSLVLSDEYNIDLYRLSVLEFLLENFEKSKDFNGFVTTFHSYKDLMDQVYEEMVQLQLSDIDWQKQASTLEEQINEQELELSEIKTQLQNSQLILGALASIAFMLLIAIFWLKISQSKKKARLISS